MTKKALYYTAKELAEGAPIVPETFSVTSRLVYSSPATLAYNSPGAEGYGVKRAALAVPGSVMLIVSPPCCGRNTSLISRLPGYHGRFFYLNIDETDLVTGRHLKLIPKAVSRIVSSLSEKPSVVMICATCVDALLGTDWDRVCKKAEEMSGVRVRPSYMYALTREGRKPPMVHVRQSIYSLLEKQERFRGEINLLGFFPPLKKSCELPELLTLSGARRIRQIGALKSYEEFEAMGRASFNILLNPECRPAAHDLAERLGQPYVELSRFYDPERLHRQYMAFFSALGVKWEEKSLPLYKREAELYEESRERAQDFFKAHKGLRISVGECANADPFELALALSQMGAEVLEVFATVTEQAFPYISRLAKISPGTRFYCNQDPSMRSYRPGQECRADLTIGKDAMIYHPESLHLPWNEDAQPFGYEAVLDLYGAMDRLLDGKSLPESREGAYSKSYETDPSGGGAQSVPGLFTCLTPFAPDQSGAVSVLYGLPGMSVVVDAGGCTGNICGFDEPRWLSGPADTGGAVFSAGLRDMDAILGRDDLLVQKLCRASEQLESEFIALIGTPVPAVIATDYRALKRMAEKKTHLPVICISSNGMRYYDAGAGEAYLSLIEEFAGKGEPLKGGTGILGLTPMDFDLERDEKLLLADLRARGEEGMIPGLQGGLAAFKGIQGLDKILVVSPSGLAGAKWLKERFGIPYELACPLPAGEELINKALSALKRGERVLIVQQFVRAFSLRGEILLRAGEAGIEADPSMVCAASWFMIPEEIKGEGDLSLRWEEDFSRAVKEGSFGLLAADPVMRELVPFYKGDWADLPHFAVSGLLPGKDGI